MIIVSALSLALIDKERLSDWEKDREREREIEIAWKYFIKQGINKQKPTCYPKRHQTYKTDNMTKRGDFKKKRNDLQNLFYLFLFDSNFSLDPKIICWSFKVSTFQTNCFTLCFKKWYFIMNTDQFESSP